MLRWACVVIKEVEGLGVRVVCGAYLVGELGFSSVQGVVEHARTLMVVQHD